MGAGTWVLTAVGVAPAEAQIVQVKLLQLHGVVGLTVGTGWHLDHNGRLLLWPCLTELLEGSHIAGWLQLL